VPNQDPVLKELEETKELLAAEKRRSANYAEELRLLKLQNLAVQKQVEQEEEFITNKLMKRLQQLKDEKQTLANEVEHEEEYLVNTLQKRLQKLNGEKVDLENQLEMEQEYIVNKLQKTLEELKQQQQRLNQEKVDLENQLEAEQEYIVNKLQKQVDGLAKEKANLQQEKADLRRHVRELAVSAEHLYKEKIRIEAEKEMEEESIVNRLQRQIEQLIQNYKVLEGKLEAKGVSSKELAPLTIDSTTEWTYARHVPSPTRRSSRDSNASGCSRRSSGMYSSSLGSLPYMTTQHSAPLGALRSPSIDSTNSDRAFLRQHASAGLSTPRQA
jgi:coiled-coil domain-containing protein 6